MRHSAGDGELADLCAECHDDPLMFVLTFFPWGDGALAGHDGPDAIQREFKARQAERPAGLGQPCRS